MATSLAYRSSQGQGSNWSCGCSLYHSHSHSQIGSEPYLQPTLQQQCQILNPLSQARDWTHILTERVLNSLSHKWWELPIFILLIALKQTCNLKTHPIQKKKGRKRGSFFLPLRSCLKFLTQLFYILFVYLIRIMVCSEHLEKISNQIFFCLNAYLIKFVVKHQELLDHAIWDFPEGSGLASFTWAFME